MIKQMLVFLAALIMAFSLVSAHHCNEIPTHLSLKVTLHNQDTLTRTLNIHAHKTGPIHLSSHMPGLSILTPDFNGEEGEEYPAVFEFNASGMEPGVYVGLVAVDGEGVDYAISIILEVESEYRTYDLNLEIPPLYTTVKPGDKVVFQTSLFNLRVSGQSIFNPSSLNTHFVLYAPDGRILRTDEEGIIITDTTKITKSFTLPTSVDCEEYILAGSITDPKFNSTGVASQTFRVSLPPQNPLELIRSLTSFNKLVIIFLIIIIIGIALLIKVNRSHGRNLK